MSTSTEFQQELKKTLPTAYQGSIEQIIKFVKEYSNEMTEEDEAIRDNYLKRFFDYEFPKTDDLPEFLSELLTSFYWYWAKQMMGEESLEKGSDMLVEKLTQLVMKYIDPNMEITGLESMGDALVAKVEELGYYTLMGITKPYFEFLLWKKTTERVFQVELPDGKADVKILFLEDFLCHGWMGFATFDRAKTGGWASKEAIYSVGSPPKDLNDEKFNISILKHEGRHFLDYKTYPNLEGPELEYRAKLTELSSAKETLFELIERFLVGRDESNREAPHSLGNYYVIQLLSRELFGKEVETDLAKWKKKGPDEINQAAQKLIKANNSFLSKKEPKEIESFLGTKEFLDYSE
jgi:hypothetical protein